MTDFKAAKDNKTDMHGGQLEVYERHAENLADRKEHSDQMFEFAKNQVQDIHDLMKIEAAKQDAQYRFQEAFREQVEVPTEEIKKEIYKDIEEINRSLVSYKRIAKIILRDKEFNKTTTKKIKR